MEKIEILMNGDIYLKRRPNYVEYSFSEIEAMNMEKDLLVQAIEETFQEIKDHVLELEGPEEKRNRLLQFLSNERDQKIADLDKQQEEMLETGKPDYEEYKSFWMLSCEDGIQLYDKTNNKPEEPKKPKKYPNKEEMEKDFISLRELLADAEYLGLEYIVPERVGDLLIVSIGGSGKENGSGFIATYYMGDRAIIFNKRTDEFELAIYEEVKPQTVGCTVKLHDEYMDKAELYQAIFKQITKKKRLEM